MKDELIKFETAKLAKEKGCTLDLYNDDWEYEDEHGDTFVSNYEPNENDEIFNVRRKIQCSQSILQRWIREEHKIDTGLYYWDDDSYSYKIQKISGIGKMKHYTKDVWVGTYEETLEQALLKALMLL